MWRLLGRFQLLQRFPITIVVAAPYVILILPLALINHNPDTDFIIRLLLLAVLGSGVVECIAAPLGAGDGWSLRLRAANSRTTALFACAKIVTIVSILADLTYTLAGGGTIFTQVAGVAVSSPLGQIAVLLTSYKYISVSLLISAFVGGQIPRRQVFRWVGALLLVQMIVAASTARTAPLVSFLTFIAVMGLIFRLLKFKEVFLAIVVVLLAWPTVFELRNQLRETGGVAVSTSTSAEDRLRFDLQISRADHYDVPVSIGQPGLEQTVRYGLVPRLLDPERPTISTGTKINYYLGGSSTSAFTFLPLGTIYFLEGPTVIPLYYGFWALVGVVLVRTGGAPGPVRLAIFGLAFAGPLGWANTYPDSSIEFLQNLVSAAPVVILLTLSTMGRSAASALTLEGKHHGLNSVQQ